MKSLRIDEDTLIADDDEILERMRDWFEAWHRGEAQYRTGTHAPDTDWLAVYEDRDKFMEMTLECGANDELRGLIWDALQSTRSKLDDGGRGTLRERMSTILNRAPTLEEFKAVLRKGVGGRAPGMTGLTYGLMKIWPEELMDRVYDLLVRQWNSDSMSEFMKWRWLCPIPKKQGDISMEDLRPLSLVEVLRKSWSTTLSTT